MRILSPMKSEVELAFGFSRWIVATGDPVLVGDHAERVARPHRPEDARPLCVLLPVVTKVVRVRPGGGTTAAVVDVGVLAALGRCSRPARTSTTATVTASRNAAGAA